MIIIRGTTPTQKFHVTFPLEDIVALFITYQQYDQVLFEKTLEDVELNAEEMTITTRLTQQDTLKIVQEKTNCCGPKEGWVGIQIRVKYEDDSAIATDTLWVRPGAILKDGEI